LYDQLYRESRLRISDLMSSLGPDELSLMTPACPQWSVFDVLAHLADIGVAIATGRAGAPPSDEWTGEQVAARRDRTVTDLVAEWASNSAVVEQTPLQSPLWLPILHDALSHEADIRGAIDAPAIPADVLAAAFTLIEQYLPRRLHPLGHVRLELDDQVIQLGHPQLAHAETVVATSLFEFWRGWFGRRSLAQLRSWVLAGDADAFAARLPVFAPRDTDLVEAGGP